MRKKVLFTVLLFGVLILAIGCTGKKDDVFFYEKDYNDIAAWQPMVTPGGGEGRVEKGDQVAIIKASADGWGGIQSEKVTLDLSKHPILLVQVRENHDGFKWGAKFVPSNLQLEDHAWGFYLIEDNNFKWNNYAGVDIRAKLGQIFIDLYGEKVEGVFWLYAAGSPEATVEITSVKMFNQKK